MPAEITDRHETTERTRLVGAFKTQTINSHVLICTHTAAKVRERASEKVIQYSFKVGFFHLSAAVMPEGEQGDDRQEKRERKRTK